MPTRKPMFPNKHLRWGTACALALLAAGGLLANNITTSAGSLVGNTGTQVFVEFDISWENSWRLDPDRWDAAWVFVKYRTTAGVWQHAHLSDTGHEPPAGCTIATGLLTPGSPFDATTNPGIGAFLYRSGLGTGTFTANDVRLLWNYGPSGVGMVDVEEVQVFAIEMVYVPQGAFFVGSGGTEPGSFTDGAWTSGNTIPLLIASENALPIGPNAGSLWGTSTFGTNTIGPPGSLPAAFPKGFQAFYCMKYELTQQQYVDFLNTLTREQQDTRTGTNLAAGVTNVTNRYVMRNSSSSGNRNGIRCDATIDATAPINFYCDLNGNGTGGETNDGQWIACNNLGWGDLAAYLDWSGLRPMTELEFEKACRGTLAPVPFEFPWGINGIASGEHTLANAGTANEGIASNFSTAVGNAVWAQTNGTPSGPKRVGIFAAHGDNNSRVTSGASLYGIMELGGNIKETCVTVGIPNGRNYQGTYGDGMLGGDGHHDCVSWPESTFASGSGLRGSSWGGGESLRVSDRSLAANTLSTRSSGYGGRGVRGAP